MRSRSLALVLPLIASCAARSNDEPTEATGRVSSASTNAIVEITEFGANPGALRMFQHVPAGLKAGAPLVLVLHGCNQGAAEMATTGWNELSDAHGFVVVYPEQKTANNTARCFNWAGEFGNPENLQRGKGENQSIKDMIDKAKTDHGVDAARVFIVGFSAGGGAATIMTSAWPELFAGAATIAGIPFSCTTAFLEVSSCMKPGKTRTATEWGDLVRRAHDGYAGPYPRMSIWQGSADSLVATANQAELVKQWSNVLATPEAPAVTDTVDGQAHAIYKDAGGRVVLETYVVDGMDHGVPVVPAKACGATGSFAHDKGICSAQRIAEFFGLVQTASVDAGTSADAGPTPPSSPSNPGPSGGGSTANPDAGARPPTAGGQGPGATPDGAAPVGYDSTCSLAARPSRAGGDYGFLFIALGLVAAARRRFFVTKGGIR